MSTFVGVLSQLHIKIPTCSASGGDSTFIGDETELGERGAFHSSKELRRFPLEQKDFQKISMKTIEIQAKGVYEISRGELLFGGEYKGERYQSET